MASIDTFNSIGKESTTVSKVAVVCSTVLLIVLMLCILAHIFLHPLAIPAQAAMYLEYGRLVSEGQTPYIQFFDYTSPLVMYLSSIPYKVAAFIPLHPILLFNVMVWKLASFSIIVLALLLFLTKSREQSIAPYLLIGFALANLVFLNEFGQIHHLMLLLTTPYFVSRILAVSGHSIDPRLLGVSGFMAGMGFALDPLFIGLFIMFEVCLAFEKGRLDTICSIDFNFCIITLTILGIYFITQQEQMGIMYLGLPFNMMFLDYEVWNGRISYFSTTPDLRNLLYFAIMVWVLALGFKRYSRFLVPLTTISILGFCMFVIQGKSLTYQTLPMMFPAFIIASIVLGICINWILRKTKQNSSKLVQGSVYAIAAIILGTYLYSQIESLKGVEYFSLSSQGFMGEAPKSDLSLFADYLASNTKAGDKILIINDQVIPAYPTLLQLGIKPGNGFLVSRLLKIARRVRYARPPEVWAKTVIAENDLWDKLKQDIDRGNISMILVNEDSMKPALDEKDIYSVINDKYEPTGFLDWDKTDKKQMSMEYLGQRTPFHIYKLKNKSG